ncbi:hypothetical protein GGR57DRAFT_290471 [Xylariaceae sp. FL1272]|nr:hypothetical protein GGR57DRAFT_290471 [Xylariaceae sp. FL1272]
MAASHSVEFRQPFIRIAAVFHLLAHLGATQNTTATPSIIHQYAPTTYVESTAIRPNGHILPITTTSSILNDLDPETGTLTPIYDFNAAGNAIQGIVALSNDVFLINALTCNISQLTCTQGSVHTWRVDVHPPNRPEAREIATWPKAGFLNGMTALNARTVLIADSFLGGIWSVDAHSGASRLLFTDDSMAPSETIGTGVNGIRVVPDSESATLYFTNSALGTLSKMRINSCTGAKTGNASVIASGLSGPDDFALDCVERSRFAYLANGAADQVLKMDLNSGESSVVASLPGPTSLRWSEADEYGQRMGKESVLYVSTIGGLAQYIAHDVTLGGAGVCASSLRGRLSAVVLLAFWLVGSHFRHIVLRHMTGGSR